MLMSEDQAGHIEYLFPSHGMSLVKLPNHTFNCPACAKFQSMANAFWYWLAQKKTKGIARPDKMAMGQMACFFQVLRLPR